MNLRKITWLLALPVLILVIAVSTWSWLLHTESGANWLFETLDSSIQGSVEAASLSGDLASGLRLEGFRFNDGATLFEVERLAITVSFDLLPPAIRLEAVRAETLTIQALRESAQPTDWESVLPGIALPIPVRFEVIGISGLEFIGVSGETGLSVNSVEAAGSLHRELVLDHASVILPSHQLALSGRLGLIRPHPLALEFTTSGETTMHGSLNGKLKSAAIRLDSRTPPIQASGTLGNLLRKPEWDLVISSPRLEWPPGDDDPAAWLTSMEVRTSGDWSDYRLALESILGLENLEPARLQLAGGGSGESFTARRVSLEGPSLSLEAAAALSWQDQLRLEADANLKHLNPGNWLETWPDNHPVEGRATVQWSGQALNISGFSLGVRDTTFSAEGHGMVDLQSGIVDAELGWRHLNWPFDTGTPDLSSENGSLSVSGQPKSWKLNGTLDLQAGELPGGQLRLSGAGNMESLDVTVHEGKVLGGIVSGDLSWNWTGGQEFSVKIAAGGIDITPLVPRYPGVLNANLTASGELEPFRLDAELHNLDGNIRAYPVSAHGAFHIERNRWRADGLKLHWAESSLALDGDPYQPQGIAFSADIDTLATLSDGFSGSLAGQGALSLYSATPHFSARLSGEKLTFGEIEIERLELRERSENGTGAGSDLLLTGLVIGERPIESVSARFSGNEPLERVVVKAQINGTNLELGLQGSVRDWDNPLGSGWRGLLSELRLDHQGQFILTLDQAAALEFSPDHIALEAVCFSGTRDTGMCLESSWRSPHAVDFSARLNAIPVGLLEHLIDTDLAFTQILNGALNWSRTPAGKYNGGARIEISPGVIRVEDDDELALHTGAGLFGFEVVDGQIQRGNLDIAIEGAGGFDLDFSLPDLRPGLDSPIEGRARIDLDDIGRVGKIFPVFDTINGELDVNLILSGTLSDPAFTGSVALVDGYLEHQASGLSFTEINLSGDVSELDQSELRGSFRAGEGVGEISATFEFENILSPAASMALKGQSLTIIEVPDLKVIADPDIELTWRNNRLEIDGRLVVPTARLSPSYLPQSSARQSEDVVIVAGELPEPETDFFKDRTFSIGGSLELELGDQVVIDLDLAQANVSGIVQFNWHDELIPVASGSYNVSGEIQAYGQLLRVTRGRIGFPDIPADNPHLNIRAEREIFGNSQIRRAGLMVGGTLRRPVVEAYTVPMTNRDRARTLLVTGSDFDFERGVGAVDVGTYIMPRLFVSYGIGVFEEGNVVSARYDLGRGFGVKATSGQRETGLDINYRFER